MDIENLKKALDNETNEEFLKTDSKKIAKMKNDILQKLGLSKDKLKKLHKTLKYYRFIDEIPELEYGRYIRWINLTNPENIKLTTGGIVCEMKVEDEGLIIVCKNFMNMYFQLNMNESLIFQKLTDQEKIILSALDYLNN